MKTFSSTTSRTLRALVAVGALLALATPSGRVAAEETQQVPLHNTDAPTEGGSNCPNAVDDFWHFVATPGSGNFAFESITIVAGNNAYQFTGAQIIVNNNSNNVFVKVPAGVNPYSIQLGGSFAVISPATPAAKFVLSHYCDGGGTTTTTTTTTSSSTTSTTSTTSSTTTTTDPGTTTTTTDPGTTTTTTDAGTTTTTTDAGTTTTTTDAGTTTTSSTAPGTSTTTTSVAQLPPATTTSTTPLTDPTTTSSSVAQVPPVGPTTTLLVAPTTAGSPTTTPALPVTGSDAAAQVALAAAAVLGAGLGIVAISRRRGTVEG